LRPYRVRHRPVFDIKPYVAAFDTPYAEKVHCGSFDAVELPAGATPDGLTMRTGGNDI